VEIHQLHIKPADFFTCNPAIDVPGKKNESSVLVDDSKCCESGEVQKEPVTHMQGTGPDLDPNDVKSKL
jgi:primary-amine oxidase